MNSSDLFFNLANNVLVCSLVCWTFCNYEVCESLCFNFLTLSSCFRLQHLREVQAIILMQGSSQILAYTTSNLGAFQILTLHSHLDKHLSILRKVQIFCSFRRFLNCPYLKLSSEEINMLKPEMRCVQGLNLWRNSSREINHEIFKGYLKGNSDGKISEIVAGCLTSLSFIYSAA